jgi:glycosyltransferase involved in cell wall biosynthesis
MHRIEIVAAIRNEEKSLPLFVERVRALPLPSDVELRLTFVEDSSTDGTMGVLRDLAISDVGIGYYSLEEGFGQGPAIIFGLSRSRSDAAILMDADGSHPPEEIPRMIELHLAGASVIQCVRRNLAGRPAYRRIGTSTFQILASWLAQFDLAEQSIYYRLVSKAIAEQLVAEPRYWRFLRFPLPREPGELVKLEIDTTERTHDESKYGPMRLAGVAVDAVLSLMSPGRLWTGLGIVALVAALLFEIGGWPISLLLALAGIWIVRQHRLMRSADLLSRMRVRESANVGGGPPIP